MGQLHDNPCVVLKLSNTVQPVWYASLVVGAKAAVASLFISAVRVSGAYWVLVLGVCLQLVPVI